MSGNGQLKDGLDPADSIGPATGTEPQLVDLSIVIVSYNTSGLLRKCLQAVYANPHHHYRFEVLVVDNNSKDDSVSMVRAEFPQAHLIANNENRGFAAASNQALSVARGDYLVLLNPDTEVVDDALWKMVAFLEAEPQAAIVGPALLYPDGSFQEGAFHFPGLGQLFFEFFPLNWRFTRSRLNGRYPRRLYEGEFPQAFEIDFPLGACLMVRRAVLEKIGLMDEDFFMYMEEIDWCYRVKQSEMPAGYSPVGLRFRAGRRKPHHWKIYCLPSARIIHHAGASTRQFREDMQVQLWRSRFYFFRKHYSRRFMLAARLLTYSGLGWRMLQAVVGRWRGKLASSETQLRVRTYRRIWKLTR
ncbi:MAG TPA: glycosyltransferase family 2 protein [Chloroflexia bacterium]|nr:glycosyltransferase family 2 protein [Chloroflexia bacterium]